MFRLFLILAALTACAPFTAKATERRVAEWVIRQGGRVIVQPGGTPLSDLSQLPPTGIYLEGVDLYGTIIEPKDLEQLSGLTKLKELYLPGPSWNPGAGSKLDANEELKFLSSLTSLEKLHFSLHFLTNVNVQDKGLKHLETLKNLRELRLAQGRIRNFSLAAFPLLESVDLSYSTATDEVLKSLAGSKHLKRLQLRDTLVTDAGLAYLKDIVTLEEIDLYGLKISDTGIAHLRGLRALRKLNLSGGPITDAGAEVLAALTRLQDLNLYRAELTNTGLAQLASLKQLEALDVRYSRVTAAGVAKLKSALPKARIEFSAGAQVSKALPSLSKLSGKSINLARSAVNDSHMKALSANKQIEELNLEATEIGDLGLAELAKLSNLRKLRLNATTVSDRGLAALAGMNQLEELSLAGTLVRNLAALPESLVSLDLSNLSLSDEAFGKLAALPKLRRVNLAYTDLKLRPIPQLQALDLTGTEVDDAMLSTLAQMPELEELLISHGRFTEKGFTALAPLTKLRRFEAVRTRLGPATGDTLKLFTKLERLNLDYTAVNNAVIAQLASLPLRELKLDSTNVTDAAVELLAKMPTLRELNLYHTTVSETAHDKLKQALPQTKIVWDRDSKLPNRRGS